MKHVPYLDGWRGIAILLVLASHFLDIFRMGRTGVDFFFVLSGLLMSRILFVEKVPLAVFYKRRIARIFPLFYLYIDAIAVLAPLEGVAVDPRDTIYSCLMLRTYLPGTDLWQMNIPLGHFWSLFVEEHCYIILSVIACISRSGGENFARYAVSGCALICIGFFFYYRYHPVMGNSHDYLRTECAGFALMVSSACFLWQRRLKLLPPSWLPLLALGAGLFLGIHIEHGPLKYLASPLCLAIALNTFESCPRWVMAILCNKPLCWFGVCSFSIYVWQEPFFEAAKNGEIGFLAAFMLALAVATVSYYGYESPMRKWLRNSRLFSPAPSAGMITRKPARKRGGLLKPQVLLRIRE